MQIQIFTAGKPKQELSDLISSYILRASKFASVELTPVKPHKLFDTLLKHKNLAHIILLDEKGKNYNSLEFAKHLENLSMMHKKIIFAVGPSEGFSDEQKELADEFLSLSFLTLQHDIATLVLAEQLYRAFSILNNHPYHKD